MTGWYKDPIDLSRYRFFDGHKWSWTAVVWGPAGQEEQSGDSWCGLPPPGPDQHRLSSDEMELIYPLPLGTKLRPLSDLTAVTPAAPAAPSPATTARNPAVEDSASGRRVASSNSRPQPDDGPLFWSGVAAGVVGLIAVVVLGLVNEDVGLVVGFVIYAAAAVVAWGLWSESKGSAIAAFLVGGLIASPFLPDSEPDSSYPGGYSQCAQDMHALADGYEAAGERVSETRRQSIIDANC